jgi:hypothetical protein
MLIVANSFCSFFYVCLMNKIFCKVYLTMLFLFFVGFIYSQQKETISPYLYYDTTTINPAYGSAKQLKGKTHIVNCYVSVGNYKWSAAEKKSILAKQAAGLEWLKNQGVLRNISDFSFSTSNIGFDNDIQINKIERDAEPSKLKVNWVPLVLDAAGYKDLSLFYDLVKSESKADNIVVIIFAKERGRSYAQPAYNNARNNNRFLEGAVIYDQQFNGEEMTSASMIHEMLHLFGARDIYKSKTKNDDAVTKMRSVFSNSIMLDTHRDIKPLFLEQLTAWCIGWSKNYYGWYKFF